MNLKKAKRLRQWLRSLGSDPGARSYLRHNVTGQIVVSPQTGRSTYQNFKKLALAHDRALGV